jgi:hypothetical protein
MPFPRKHDALPAFHLPRVCRQIYGETATLTYSLSTFTFPCHLKCEDCIDDEIFEHWNLRANRDAITTIEPNANLIEEYIWLQYPIERTRLGLDRKEGKLRVTYPSLRCIYVSNSAVEYTTKEWKWKRTAKSLGLVEPENLKRWRRFTEGLIKISEGEDTEVIFRD